MKDKDGKEIEHLFIEDKSRAQMRSWLEAGDFIAVYRNVDLGHPEIGHLKFLRVGPGATLQKAPQVMPDIPGQINWRYYLQGVLDALPPPNWSIALTSRPAVILTVPGKKKRDPDVKCEVILTDEEIRDKDGVLKTLHDQKAEAALHVGVGFDSYIASDIDKLRDWAKKHPEGVWSVFQQAER